MTGALNVQNSSSPAKYVSVNTISYSGNYYPAVYATNTSGTDYPYLALAQQNSSGTFFTSLIFSSGVGSAAGSAQFNNTAYVYGDFHCNYNATLGYGGNIYGSSKSFRIPHPVLEDKDLVFTSVEGPRNDLIFRGSVQLEAGRCDVDLNVESRLTEGTFEALTQEVDIVSLCNKTGFTRIRASNVVDGKFTIIAEDTTCTDMVSWVVMAARADTAMFRNPVNDAEGRLVPEQPKMPPPIGE